ncbi:MAG TPA: AgmX/PglI C-terminal domain-containing protein [Polyangiaceae bacterium]|nr:AgmX/PglI C-terminal domain-containing protein [Polyangiaceae bacterium]
MTSPHSPVAFDQRVFSTHNPFLQPEPAPVQLRSASQGAPQAESIEVTVLWGTSVLAVRQLTPPRAFAVGEVGGTGGAGTSRAGDIDFALSAERLGSERREVVAVRHGRPFAIFDTAATPRVLEKGQLVDASSVTVDCSDIELGACGIELCQDRVVIVESSGVSFRLAGMEKPERVPRMILGGAERSSLTTMSAAAILQGLLVASLAYFTPGMDDAHADELNRDRLILMQAYLDASAERNREEEQKPATNDTGGQKGAPAERHNGPEGKSGKPNAKAVDGRLAIKGDQAERKPGRAELIAEAKDFGLIGMLNTMNASMAPSSPFAEGAAQGPDSADTWGNMWGDQIGDVAGSGGLGVSGLERGGGGTSAGSIGVGTIGTCMGLDCNAWGRGGALTGRGHVAKAPKIGRGGETIVSGRLPSDVIQRIVRQNFGRFRACYEIGLRTNPNLEGRVTARFVIGRDGAVSNVSAGGDLPDPTVRSCVASAFYGLSFPSPENGIVTVSYPIMLTPG